ncbi:hypothetical protein B0H19DRAFT_1234207, partial [Mycena capillaripes]
MNTQVSTRSKQFRRPSYPIAHTQSGRLETPRRRQEPTVFNFPPNFPEESVERYPCLTRALANNYPGSRHSTNDTTILSPVFASSVGLSAYFDFPELPSDSDWRSPSPATDYDLRGYIGPIRVSRNSAPTQRAPMMFNFPPHFPEESIERYPSLTQALGDSYPGLRTCTNTTALSSVLASSMSIEPSSPGADYDSTNLDYISMLSSSEPRISVQRQSLIDRYHDHDVHRPMAPFGGFAAEEISPSGTVNTDRSEEQSEEVLKHRCYLCGKLFRRLGFLLKHVKRHDGPTGPTYTCDICGRPYLRLANPLRSRCEINLPISRPKALKTHLKRHFLGGFFRKPRPKHTCNICGKEFLRPSAVHAHLNMHYNRR